MAGGRDVVSLLPSLGCLSIGTRKEDDVGVADHEYDGFLVVPKVEDIDVKTERGVENEVRKAKKAKVPDAFKKKRYQPDAIDKVIDKDNYLDLLEEKADGTLGLNKKALYLVWKRELDTYKTIGADGKELPPWNTCYPPPTTVGPEDREYKKYTGYDPLQSRSDAVDKDGPIVAAKKVVDGGGGEEVAIEMVPHFTRVEFEIPNGKTVQEIVRNAFIMNGGYKDWILGETRNGKVFGMTVNPNKEHVDLQLRRAYAPVYVLKQKVKALQDALKKATSTEHTLAIKQNFESAKEELANAKKEVAKSDVHTNFKTRASRSIEGWISGIDEDMGMIEDETLMKSDIPKLYQDMSNSNSSCPMPPGWLTFRQAYTPIPDVLINADGSKKSDAGTGIDKPKEGNNIFNNAYIGPTAKTWQLLDRGIISTDDLSNPLWKIKKAKSTNSAWLMFMGMTTSDSRLEPSSTRTRNEDGKKNKEENALLEAVDVLAGMGGEEGGSGGVQHDNSSPGGQPPDDEDGDGDFEVADVEEDEGAGRGFKLNDNDDFEITDVQEDDDDTDDELVKDVRAITRGVRK